MTTDHVAEERGFRWSLGGVAAWFTSFGIQTIVFPWFVAVVLKEPAQRVGLAQMAMMAPAIVFMLLGGAERLGAQALLVGQAVILAAGAVAVSRLAPAPPAAEHRHDESRLAAMRDGLREVARS